MRLSVTVLVCFLAMLSGCGKKQEARPPTPAITVSAAAVDRGSITQTLDLSGTLTFIANTTVSSQVSAQVQSIEVEDGQVVKEDHLLLVFDETKIRETANQALANLQKNEATLKFMRTEWEKNLELFRSGSISQTRYDEKVSAHQNATAQVEGDKALLAKAMEDLKKTRVMAPVSGLLSNRYIEKGDWVGEGGKLFQISDHRRIYLEAFLSDLDVGRISVQKILTGGVDADVRVDSYPGRVFKGRLTYIQPVPKEARLFQIRIYLDNPEMLLLQGMFARGRVVVRVVPGVVRVPLESLLEQLRENELNRVVVVDQETKARLTQVKVGSMDHQYAQILEGLQPGDRVVVRGKEVLSNGQPLTITEEPKPETSQHAAPGPWKG